RRVRAGCRASIPGDRVLGALRRVLGLLPGLLDLALALFRLALGGHLVVAGGLAEAFLRLAAELLGLVAELVTRAHPGSLHRCGGVVSPSAPTVPPAPVRPGQTTTARPRRGSRTRGGGRGRTRNDPVIARGTPADQD